MSEHEKTKSIDIFIETNYPDGAAIRTKAELHKVLGKFAEFIEHRQADRPPVVFGE